MQPTPSFTSVPEFCTAGTRTQPSAGRLSTGYLYRDKPPAEEHNFLFGGLTENANTANSYIENSLGPELDNALSYFGITPSGSVADQIAQMIVRSSVERGTAVMTVEAIAGNVIDPVPWAADGSSIDTYFPKLCLTDFDTYKDISGAAWPDLVPKLRAVKVVYRDGLSGEIAAGVVTNWAIASNVATITFSTDTGNIAMLSALAEDQSVHGSYTNWRTVTLPSAIGGISAETYNITGVNPASRTVSFPVIAANGSGAVTATADFYAHRIAGSPNSARVFSARGMAPMGANDDNGYFVAGSLRRRGQFQAFQIGGTLSAAERYARLESLGSSIAGSASTGYNLIQMTTGFQGDSAKLTAVSDGTNGTPRVGKETHGPSVTVHLYYHGGRHVA